MMHPKHYISLILFLFFTGSIFAQTFESVEYTQWSRGVMEWNDDQMLVYGTGLTWIDRKGNIIERKRILEGIPSSTVIDALPDDNGGAWILTNTSLARITKEKTLQLIIDRTQYPKLDTKEIVKDKNGNLYCLAKTKVFKVQTNNSFEELQFDSSDKQYYFKHFDIDNNGKILIGSYKEAHVIENDTIKEYVFDKNINIQDVICTDGRMIILDYRDIYELKEGKLEPFLKGSQISRGIKFYTSYFSDINNYWLYCNKGNAFHYDNGKWTNYIPPENLTTGNFGEHMYATPDGEVWMTLKGQVILRFADDKWSRINLDKKLKIPSYHNAFQAGNTVLTKNKTADKYLTIQTGGTIENDLPGKKLSDIKNYGDVYYFSDEEGLNKIDKGVLSTVIPSSQLGEFGKVGDEWVFHDGGEIYVLRNSKSFEVKDNKHNLGWDKLEKIKIFDLHTGELALLNPKRGTILSIYQGDDVWKKLVSVDGYKLDRIRDVIKLDSTSIIITQDGDFINYDGNELSYIRKKVDKSSSTHYYPIPSSDNSIWSYNQKIGLTVYRNNEVNEYKLPMEGQRYSALRVILPMSENEYHLIFDSDILKCTF